MKNKFWEDLELLNEIGKGSISTVYKAISKDGKIYAVKHISLPREQSEIEVLLKNNIIKNASEANNYYAKTIRKEIEIMKKFNGNPYIIDYYDIIQNNSQDDRKIDFYIKLEYAEDIKRYYTNKKIDINEVLKLGIDICNALELCEKINIIHNDLKPSNIFLGNDGIYKLGDFNISVKDKEEVNGFGTPNYIAPEIYNNQSANKTTDLYSLGLVMYKLLNGSIAFKDNTNTEKDAFKIRMSGVKIPIIKDLNQEFMDVLFKACDFEINNRYNNPTEMKEALMNVKSAISFEFENKKENFLNVEHSKEETQMDIKSIDSFGIESKKESVLNIDLEDTMDIYQQELIDETLVKIKKNKNTLHNLKRFFSDSNNYKKIAGILIVIIFVILGSRTFALNRKCNEGYVNRNGVCIKGYYYCKDGYTLNENNKCQKTIESKDAKVSLSCKTDQYTLNGEYCIKNETKTPQYVYKCQDGWQKNGTKCEKTKTTSAIISGYVCPNNEYKIIDKICYIEGFEKADSEYICPDTSYKLSGNKCQKTETKIVDAKRKFYCDKDGTIDPNDETMCIYVKNLINNQCLGAGWEKKGNKCYSTRNANSNYVCEKGESYAYNKCIVPVTQEIDAKIKADCPDGYFTVGTYCFANYVNATPQYSCLDGSKPEGTKCYSKEIIDANGNYECEVGYYLNGNICYKDDTHSAIKKYICSRVYTLNGDKCEKYDIIDSKAHYNE